MTLYDLTGTLMVLFAAGIVLGGMLAGLIMLTL